MKKMKVLVTGYNGQLGYDVIKLLKEKNIDCIGVDKDDFDLLNETETKTFIINQEPNVIIHCAAYTNVDKAEDEKRLCYNINVNGTKYVAEAAKILKCKIIYISTDYIFSGDGDKPFNVTDKAKPINYYGKTKYLGELEVKNATDSYFIVRVSWVFGINGHNFVKTMLRLGNTKDNINVVDDQIGSPTYTVDLAKLLLEMLYSDKYGIYHATNEGFCSWYDFAVKIFEYSRKNIDVKKVDSSAFKTIASRPLNSRLSKSSLQENGFCRLRKWEDALKEYIETITDN